MTEGILMMEMMEDPLLRSYSVIMLDEVHEQSQNTDILMGLLKKILKVQSMMVDICLFLSRVIKVVTGSFITYPIL